MISKKYYKTRDDGVKLFRTTSDEGKTIIRNDGEEFDHAIDVENCGYTYTESENYIDICEDETEVAE